MFRALVRASDVIYLTDDGLSAPMGGAGGQVCIG